MGTVGKGTEEERRTRSEMRGFAARILITSLGLWLADVLLQRMSFTDAPSMVLSALLLGLVNALVRPVIVLLTLPITFLSLGLFLLVINGAMLLLVARLIPAFHLDGLGTAVAASVIIGLTSWFAISTIGTKRRRR